MNDFERDINLNNQKNEDYEVLPYYPAVIPPKKNKAKRVLSFFMATVLGITLTVGAGFFALPKLVEKEVSKLGYNTGISKSQTLEQAARPIDSENRAVLPIVEIAKTVGPAVVGISSKSEMQNIFGQTQEGKSTGSGIIISADGYIITNNHVIDGAKEITILINNGKEHKAKLVGQDARTDLAVLKIDVSGITHATLGNSANLQVGELAVAIGNPLGNELAGSVTVGVISALNRSITVDDRKLTLIQTDAAINPGNSGGALINSYGEVIGINSVKMAASGVEGIGFAIPINEAKPIIDDLMKNGYVKGRPVIGISGRSVSPQDSKYYNIPIGIYISEVMPYSAAEKAGIKPSDVIIKVNNEKVKTIEELNREKEKFKAGETIKITFIRNGEEKTVDLTLLEEKPRISE
jgi:serine protease Do